MNFAFSVDPFAVRSETMLEAGILSILPELDSNGLPAGCSCSAQRAFDGFLRLGNASDTAVVDYVREYGPFTSSRSAAKMELWNTNSLQSEGRGIRNTDPYLEPIDSWRSLSKEFAFLVIKAGQLSEEVPLRGTDIELLQYMRLAQDEWDASRLCLLSEEPADTGREAVVRSPEHLDFFERQELSRFVDNAAEMALMPVEYGKVAPRVISSDDLLCDERQCLKNHLKKLVDLANLRPSLTLEQPPKAPGKAPGKTKWAIQSTGQGLLAGLTAHLATAISNGTDYYRCRTCEEAFRFDSIGAEGERRARPRDPEKANCDPCKRNGEARAANQSLSRNKSWTRFRASQKKRRQA